MEEQTAEERSARVKEIAAARPEAPNRFYKEVTVQDVDGGFAIALDGRVAKTPKRQSLILPTQPLADAVAAEWAAQDKKILAATMPLTQIANTAIDGVSSTVDAVLDKLVEYAEADLLCYRVAYPESLAAKQTESWQPILDWADESFGARLHFTTGLIAVEQPQDSITAVRDAFARYSPWRLTAAYTLAGVFKSVMLALAVVEGRIDAKSAHAAATLDEDFQNTIWGEDGEAKKRTDKLATEAIAAETFAHLTVG